MATGLSPRGRRDRPFRTVALAAAVLAATLVAGCGIGASRSPVVTAGTPPAPGTSLSAVLAQARGTVVRALEAAGVAVADPRQPYRPAEPPAISDTPRTVLQAQLTPQLAHGYVSIYEFSSPAAAADAARAQADYVASGPGRVQFPLGTQFIVRQLGSAMLFYAVSPEAAAEPGAADVAAALRMIGTEIEVPS